MNELWIVTGGVFVLLIAAVAGWCLYARKHDGSHSILEDPAFIRETLQTALDMRSRFDIRFEAQELNDRVLRGPCVAVGDTSLLLDTNLRYSVPSWRGQKVQIFFNLPSSRTTVFYSFSSVVAALPSLEGGYALELTLPAQLRSEQRRAFVRLSPSQSLIGDFSLWVGRPGLDRRRTPEGITKPDVPFSSIKLHNISAGGARLILEGKFGLELPLEKEIPVCIRGVLLGAENKVDLALWLDAEVVMTREEPVGRVLSVRFRKWALEGEDPKAELSWFPVSPEGGVPPLAAWVMHKHLELYRDKAAL